MTELIEVSGAEPLWPTTATRLWTTALRQSVDDHRLSTKNHPLGDLLGDRLDLARPPFITSGVRAVIPTLASLQRRVVVETPTFADVPRLFRRHGCEVELGPLDQVVRRSEPAGRHLIWLTSPGRNPDGAEVTPALADALARFQADGGLVVQNETYRWHCRDAVRIPGAIAVGSLGKLAGSWCRLGWLAGELPTPLAADLPFQGPPAFWQSAFARLIQNGGLDLLVHAAREVGSLTRQVAATIRGDGKLAWSGDGPSLLVRIAACTDPVEVLRAELGLVANPGPAFHAAADAVRLCFTGRTAADVDWERIRAIGTRLGGIVVEPGQASYPAGDTLDPGHHVQVTDVVVPKGP